MDKKPYFWLLTYPMHVLYDSLITDQSSIMPLCDVTPYISGHSVYRFWYDKIGHQKHYKLFHKKALQITDIFSYSHPCGCTQHPGTEELLLLRPPQCQNLSGNLHRRNGRSVPLWFDRQNPYLHQHVNKSTKM